MTTLDGSITTWALHEYADRRSVPRVEGAFEFLDLPFLAIPEGAAASTTEPSRSIPDYPLDRLRLLAGLDWLLTVRCDAVNISVGPRGRFIDDDPLQVATRALVERGKVVVVAAGNEGPGPGTTLALARAPWVIAVGAVNQDLEVLESSSRGGGGVPGPTFVSSGQDDLDPEQSGTSFAAPRVARASILIGKCLSLLISDLTSVASAQSFEWSAPLHLPWIGFVDTGWDPEIAPYRHGPVSTDLIARDMQLEAEFTPDMRRWAETFVAAVDMNRIPSVDPELIRRALKFGAVSIDESDEAIGDGYVGIDTARGTIRSLTPQTVAALLGLELKAGVTEGLGAFWDTSRIQIMEDVFLSGVRNSVAKVL